MHSLFERWDLRYTGILHGSSANKPIEQRLDNIYVPLRLTEGYDPRNVDAGKVFDAIEIQSRIQNAAEQWYKAAEWQVVGASKPTPFVIRGPAGCGKTTWMRYTFRRLLAEKQTLPIMITLRDLAKRWSDSSCQGVARSIDAFLDDWIGQHLGDGWQGQLQTLLRSTDYSTGPNVVLLIDGWDELGPFGNEFREKLLGFSSEHPFVLIIASSRPYGGGRPTYSDGFELLDVQPLSRKEIDHFAQRFIRLWHGEDESIAAIELHRFQSALDRAPEAAELAQTMLLLVMMLFVSRSEELPEKRHLLYERCITNFLVTREQTGSLLADEQWRPMDSEVRRQIVAA